MSAHPSQQLQLHEQFLLMLDQFPFGAAYRICLGYFLVPLSTYASITVRPELNLALWFLGILLALRLVPLAIRRLLPFPERVTAAWTQRRQLAKRFDSYQWRKLVWFGVGLTAYAVSSKQLDRTSLVVLALFCVAGGALGNLAWRFKSY